MIYRISRNNLTPSSSACLGLCWKSPSDLRGFWWPRHDRSSPSPSGRTGCTICHGILRKGRVNSGHQVDTGRAFIHFQDTLTCQCQIRMRHRTLLLWKWQRHWHQRRESWIRNIATVDTPFQQVFGQVIASTSVCRGSEEKHVTLEAICPRRKKRLLKGQIAPNLVNLSLMVYFLYFELKYIIIKSNNFPFRSHKQNTSQIHTFPSPKSVVKKYPTSKLSSREIM